MVAEHGFLFFTISYNSNFLRRTFKTHYRFEIFKMEAPKPPPTFQRAEDISWRLKSTAKKQNPSYQ